MTTTTIVFIMPLNIVRQHQTVATYLRPFQRYQLLSIVIFTFGELNSLGTLFTPDWLHAPKPIEVRELQGII